MEETSAPQGAGEGSGGGEKKDYTKIIIGVVVVLIVLGGIQRFASPERRMEQAMERAYEDAGVDVDIARDGTNMTFTGDDGEAYTVTAGEDVALPDNWPRSVPIPSDAEVKYAGTMTAGMQGGGGTTVSYTTRQSVSDITEYYKRELASAGWTIAATMATADGSMMSATKGEQENVAVYVGASPEGTTVSLSVQVVE